MVHAGVLLHRFNHGLETQASGIRIEALSTLVALVMSFLVIFGSWRRWCTNWFIQKGVMAAYFLSFTLVTYTIGLMQSAAVKVEVYHIWATCFLTVFGCTNSISAYSLDDNYHLWPQVFQCILYAIYVLLILFSVADGVSFIAVFPMVMVALVKVYIRTGSSIRATTSWFASKMLADFMESANNKFKARQSEDHDPSSMKGYPYVISFKVKSQDSLGTLVLAKNIKAPFYSAENAPEHCDVITIDKAWEECSQADGPLRTSLHACKDITLSYSLFQLLLLRFFGYTCCGESAKSKGKDFVLKNLLGHRSHHERAFEVIETELAFLYDYFFTKYPSLNSRGTMIWGLASVVSLLCVMALIVARAAGIFLTGGGSSDASSVTKATLADNTITVIILAALALLEVLQMVVFYWTSNWGRVDFVCQYIQQATSSKRTASCSMRLKAFLSRVKLFSTRKYYWKQKIGQYSLLHSIGPNVCLGSSSCIINKCCWILRAVGLPHSFFRAPQAQIRLWHVKVPPEVRGSVVRSLEQTGGHITNGVSSLDRNHVSHLRWACSQCIRTSAEDKGSQTRTILTWHIATCYCEMAMAGQTSDEAKAVVDRVIDITLSRYCAYLIIYAPQLLPGHKCDTHCLFRAAAHEAASFLKDEEDKYEAMRNMAEQADQESIFGSGVMLGMQLEETGVHLCWEVLGQFWSEMMLYLAPSGNITEHIEQLAQGGEFITHLWALLYHAGIAKREDILITKIMCQLSPTMFI